MDINTTILLTIIPNTSTWSLEHAGIMVICNLICIGIGRYAIKVRGLGPEIPIVGLKEFGLPELLATTSLGHAIGAGAIIGLSSIGILS